MKKRKKRSPKPRYIVIKIQYYPISNTFIFFLCSLFFLFILGWSATYVSNSWVESYVTREISFYRNSLSKEKEDVIQDPIIFHGPRNKKQVAFTFDADMTYGMKQDLENGYVASYYNKDVIDVLTKTKTKATLFLSGLWIEKYHKEAVALAHNSLFELASHSYSHPSFAGDCYGLGEIPDEQNNFQIQKTQKLLKSLTGIENKYFRFPGGCYSENDLKITKALGVLAVQWDSVGNDGFNNDPIAITHNVLRTAQNGSIIVLHMHGGPTAPMTAVALPNIISALKHQGYTFVTLSELLNQITGSCRSFLPSDVLTSFRALDGSPSTRVTPLCNL